MSRNGEKTGGRKKGTPNKIGNDLRERINLFLNENFATVAKGIKRLPAREKAKFYLDLLQYGLPKLQATSFEIDFDSLTEEQLDKLIDRIMAKARLSEVA